ncbi:MAG TPA: hypothetical protein EYH00_01560 [Archaeoglobus profundus]|nr:hypothetical protein [Archaeoglobus profundus]
MRWWFPYGEPFRAERRSEFSASLYLSNQPIINPLCLAGALLETRFKFLVLKKLKRLTKVEKSS